MNSMFEEIDYRETPIGALALRRRRLHPEGEDIWEIKLDEGYLMSSRFVDGEIALARLALEMLPGDRLDIVVGGLGLGYTARAVLEDMRVERLTVVELIPEVIEWHRSRKLPLGQAVAGDPRTTLLQGDFFAMACKPGGLDSEDCERRYDAIMVDIDHSTKHLIDEASASFYETQALTAIGSQLKEGGIFALWSSDENDPKFEQAMRHTFDDVRVERVEFYNPYQDRNTCNLIYLGRRRPSSA